MGFLILTDLFSNSLVIKLDEIITVEEEMSETVVTLKTGRRITIQQTVDEVFDELINLRKK